MIKHKFVVASNNQTTFSKEDAAYKAFREAEKAVSKILWSNWQNIYKAQVGQKGAVTVDLSWECTWIGRAPARPKDVIAAEKAARAAKSQARQAQRDQWRAEAEQRIVNLRKRIRQQVDHAFALGKHGTEPAAKYITCQHCDGPAAVVCLNQPIARGASVLDEDTIVGALCAAHIQYTPYNYYNRGRSGDVVKIPCAKLEFFYDGVRQIAIKP